MSRLVCLVALCELQLCSFFIVVVVVRMRVHAAFYAYPFREANQYYSTRNAMEETTVEE